MFRKFSSQRRRPCTHSSCGFTSHLDLWGRQCDPSRGDGSWVPHVSQGSSKASCNCASQNGQGSPKWTPQIPASLGLPMPYKALKLKRIRRPSGEEVVSSYLWIWGGNFLPMAEGLGHTCIIGKMAKLSDQC